MGRGAPRSLLFYVVGFALWVTLLYPLMAIAFRLEEAAFDQGPEIVFDVPALMGEILAAHFPSIVLAIAASTIPAIVTHHLRARTAAALAEVAEMNRKQREFISVVSHEFRTPLTAIQGFSELMSEDELSAEQVKEFSRDINADAQRLARMISEILDLDRLESGRTTLALTTVDLGSYVQDSLDRVRVMFPEHRFDGDVGALAVRADPDKLVEILTNLLGNAGKYTPVGSRIMVRAVREDANVHLVVEDDGPGIAPEAIPHLFERYYRVEATRRIPGTGLGLAIVRQLITLHGGRVWCESQVGKGTAFHVVLPAPVDMASAA